MSPTLASVAVTSAAVQKAIERLSAATSISFGSVGAGFASAAGAVPPMAVRWRWDYFVRNLPAP